VQERAGTAGARSAGGSRADVLLACTASQADEYAKRHIFGSGLLDLLMAQRLPNTQLLGPTYVPSITVRHSARLTNIRLVIRQCRRGTRSAPSRRPHRL